MSNYRVKPVSFLFNGNTPVGVFEQGGQEYLIMTLAQDVNGNAVGVAGPSGLLPLGVPVTTFAVGRANASTQYSSFFATDVGNGNFFYSNGTRVKPVNGSILLDSIDTANNGVIGTVETQVNPTHLAIPAGVISGFDRFRVYLAASKAGVADTCTIRLRFGPLGTVADPILATVVLAQANQSLGTILEFKRASSTTVQKQGAADPNINYAGSSPTAYPAAVTVSNMDSTVMFMSITTQMTTGGLEIPTLQDYTLELYSTDS